MSVEQLNRYLNDYPSQAVGSSPLYVLITGASGAGKTYLTKALAEQLDTRYVYIAYFDQIGVPPEEDMIKEYGSGERWQEAMTHKWLQALSKIPEKRIIILEGQYRPQFALDACQELEIRNYILIVIHANQKVREQRLLHDRQQPDLANDTMENWAQFLKQSTLELGGTVIDTSTSTLQHNINEITVLIRDSLRGINSLNASSPLY